ncbi:helix-turn-helix domain-containing protein [Pseudomonas putida]|uniref:helix-turn-helix domain-containing protein n=1 Tax=Pseudomonas putida TaxID=303 RepID=UPI002117990D|nr:transcriptional regulator [Pseudomonas putida]
MLRHSLAAVLRHVRRQQQVVLTDLEEGVTASHLSRVERGERGVTIEKLDEIARQLSVHPLSLLALAYSAEEAARPNDLLKRVLKEVAALASGTEPFTADQEDGHSRAAVAAKRSEDVQRLKAEGLTKAEIARSLAISKQTVARYW